jgi:hypothetical protein
MSKSIQDALSKLRKRNSRMFAEAEKSVLKFLDLAASAKTKEKKDYYEGLATRTIVLADRAMKFTDELVKTINSPKKKS